MECPTCGHVLNTERGVRQHHTKVHGDPLPNRECTGCGTAFYDPKSRREFCDACNPNAGEHNGNWKDAKERTTCKLCGDEFEYYPSDKDGVYCAECVTEGEGLLPENPAERIERVETACEQCGNEMHVLQSRLDRATRGVFCDDDCYGAWLAENVVGESHHQWEGGDLNYGEGWWRVRREALDRDDETCQHCGADTEALGRKPDVHHLVRVRDFDDPRDAHTLENVVTLCRSCHRRVEEGEIVAPAPSCER